MSIKEILSKIPNQQIRSFKKDQLIELVETCIQELKTTAQKIDAINNFDLEKKEGLINQIEEKSNSITETHEEVIELRKDIFGDEENDEEGWKDEIKEFYNQFGVKLKEITEIKNQLEGFKTKKKDEHGNDVIDEQTGEPEYQIQEGLLTKIQNFYAKETKKYKELENKIEGLLPGATSAGLASAYENNVKEYQAATISWTKRFIATIGIILLVSISIFGFLFKIEEYGITLNFLLKVFPISSILIWFAYFCTKRRSENKRLQEEYQHKLAVTKTYEGYKKEIKELSKDDDELIKNLLRAMIKAMDFNPSVTLEKKHGDKIPLQEIAETCIQELKTTAQKIDAIKKSIP